MHDTLETVQSVLGYWFTDLSLLRAALTHSSWVHEHGGRDSERLEFLGDAVLELVVSEMLFRQHPEAPEGALSALRSNLVDTGTLAEVGRELHLGDALRLGKGEDATGGRGKPTVLADATEAVLGAVFLDAGFQKARAVATTWMAPRLARLDLNTVGHEAPTWREPKGLLQEWTQARWKITPTYHTIERSGPEHAPTFTVEVRVGERLRATGTGPSKRTAAKAAAEQALDVLRGEAS